MEFEYEIKFKLFRFAILKRKLRYRAKGVRNWNIGWLKKVERRDVVRYWKALL